MMMDSLKKVIKSPLGRHFFLAIVIFSSAITLIITSYQIYNDYQHELSQIDIESEQIRKTNLQSLSQSVWVMDEVQVVKQLNGLIKYTYVDYAEIRSDGEVEWSTLEIKVDNPVNYTFPLTYNHRGSEITIAELHIKGSLNKVYFKLLNRVFFILASNAVKTFLVAIFILFLFYHMLGKHIIRLAEFAGHFGKDDELPSLTLERRASGRGDEDELDILINSITGMISTLRNREDSLKVLSTAVEQSPNAIILTDSDGNIEYVNRYFSQVSGFTREEVIGRRPNLLSSGLTPPEVYREMWRTISSGGIWTGELQNRTKSGVMFWESARIAPIFDEHGEIIHYLAIKEDITLRKSYEEKLLRQANFDSLTNLPNRILAFDRISQSLISHYRGGEHVVIMFIDLDRFKNINDTLGHAAGDKLLKDAAKRLQQCVRMEDTVARLGGDEFLVILSHIKADEHVDIIANKILETFSRSFYISGRDVYVTASIGITFFPDDGETPEILLRNADSAMYKAKAEGRNSYCYFTRTMNEQAKRRLEIESHLRNALVNREFELYFQPIMDAGTASIDTAEVLLRWRSEQLGEVPPDTFIPLAEELGLIVPIGTWVLNTACSIAAAIQTPSGRPLRIAVNVSARQFRMSDLVATVDEALNESGLPAEYLDIEVTEGILLDDAPEIHEILFALNERGIRLSIDDFGTGYSALGYLNRFPVSVLKIDRSFVHDMQSNSKNTALCSAIINMAHNLEMKVVGEGVETEAQLALLRHRGIDYVQGYLIGRPCPLNAFRELLDHFPEQDHRGLLSSENVDHP